ncbi:T9SS C-terminal target domain-containing protein [Sorangium sp. So ce1153]|uniref:T9SS C-terminal target domain-containing protein n=1 Tax=Sorangium sp. So ce1153 TaxID=3133333 RepID=UPI003F639E99
MGQGGALTGGSSPVGGQGASGSGGSGAGTGGGPGSPPGGPRVATVATPLELIPAPGLAGPALKVDLDISGRPTSEVTELGYVAWPVTPGASISKTIEGITLTFAKAGSNGSELAASWRKAAVQAPNYARLVGDGLTVSDGDSGSQIRLTLKGLPAGQHSLLAWHNITGGMTAGEVSVQVDGATKVSGLSQSSGALSNAAAPTSYVTFTAQAGKEVVILFSSTASLLINGFELDTPNIADQATSPTPTDGDEHVDADAGEIELGWKASKAAVSHDVYLGADPNVVQSATHGSPEYRGNQTGTTFRVSGLNSIDRYYWRIDEVDSENRATRGNVWYFRPRHVAFPGAEGHGRFAIGGRGGVVVHVTNLNDSGPGSFRDAIEADRGPRTIVFDVSGVIRLASRLTLTQKYVTVAGQTAPGKGIVLRAAPFGLSGVSDAAVRHVRVRLGHGETFDGMGMSGSDHSIIDHSSISWTIDEGFSSRNGKNITLQRTLISECLNIAGHSNYPEGTKHGYAASIGGDIGSFHHNLLAHCEGRNWSLAGGLDANGYFAGRLDIFNNVVYNWGGRTTDGGSHEVNFVNNYYRPGPASKVFSALKADYDNFPGTQQYYCKGNVMPGRFDEEAQDKACVQGNGAPQGYSPWVDEPWFPSYAEVHSARDAFKNVLSDVGNTLPVLDDHDSRVVKETLDGKTTYKGSISGVAGLPDRESDVGGYEDYPSETRAEGWDSDGDGLPDWWEADAGLTPSSPSGDFTEANTDLEGDGYTELEEYLAFMAAPRFLTGVGESVSVDLGELFVGFTKSPTYTAPDAENGDVSISGKTATLTPDTCGHARFSLKVTDGDGSSMTRDVLVFADRGGAACP